MRPPNRAASYRTMMLSKTERVLDRCGVFGMLLNDGRIALAMKFAIPNRRFEEIPTRSARG